MDRMVKTSGGWYENGMRMGPDWLVSSINIHREQGECFIYCVS